MSISTALSNAYSGLSVMSRSAETVSNNVSNAMTDGYSRQQVEYTAAVIGGEGSGVRIEGITRLKDLVATQFRQSAAADAANMSTQVAAVMRLADALGEPGDPGALAVQYANLDNAITAAVNAPDSIALQQGILISAKGLATTFNGISAEISRVRMDADANIARDVETVNVSLQRIESLNSEIRLLSLSGRSIATLEDQRQIAVDRVNEIIPVRQTWNADNEIAVFSRGGDVLLNGSARLLKFESTNLIAPDMTLGSGALSGITLNGKEINPGAVGSTLDGGSLAASFSIRDNLATGFQSRLDALSDDLIERFQNPQADPTLGAGDGGLFTDGGSAYASIDQVGISNRIGVNALVDPSMGGDLWRLRDGLGAVSPGAAGESVQLMRMKNALGEVRSPSVGMGVTTAMNGVRFAEEITSVWASMSGRMEEDSAYKSGLLSTLRAEELNNTGVDTDQEMQSLLVIEKAYAANARVISVLDGLMQKLLEI